MLDLDRLRRIRLSQRPIGQITVATLLRADYRWPRPTEIVVEGAERLPADRGVFLAMNHTDRYNYWPFQYWLYRNGHRFTATWVKGKYYESGFTARFLDFTNNIPLPSRGYVIATEFRKQVGRAPDEREYRILRDLVDRRRDADTPLPGDASEELRRMVGGDEGVHGYLLGFDHLFDAMLGEVVRLNRDALTVHGCNILIFPEGTRSRRLSHGHTGLAQMASYLGAPIIPVGCSGSDHLYPSNSPFSKGGRVIYRIGELLELDGPELGPYRVPADVLPLTRAASELHGDRYAAITDVVMAKINALIDPEYRRLDGDDPGGRGGVDRFL
ncbi:MAG: lysophospholipid acyltransferase family protein [Nannocystaceae bacterium]